MELSSSEKIILAYIYLCEKEGPTHITLEKLAKRTKLSLGTIRYNHDLQDGTLEKAAIEYVLKKSYEFVENGFFVARKKSHFNPVATYIECMFNWIEAYPQQGSFFFYYLYLGTTHDRQALPVASSNERAQLRIASFLYESIGLDLIGREVNIKELSIKIHASLLGCGLLALNSNEENRFKKYRSLCLQLSEELSVLKM